MVNYAVSYHPAAAIEAAIEAIPTTTPIQVIPISGGSEFMLIQGAASTP
jgi:hypothetical protein